MAEEISNVVGIQIDLDFNSEKLDGYLKKITTNVFKVKVGFDLNTKSLVQEVKSSLKGITAPIKATLDTRQFEKDIEKATKTRSMKVNVDLHADTDKFVKEVKSSIADITAPIKATLDSRKFEQDVKRLTEDREMTVATEFDVNSQPLDNYLKKLTTTTFPVKIGFDLNTKTLVKEIKSAVKGVKVPIKAELDSTEFAKKLKALTKPQSMEVKAKIDIDSQRLDNYIKKITTTEFIVKIGFDLNTRTLISNIKAATKGVKVPIKAELNSTEFDKKLKALTKPQSMEVKAEVDVDSQRLDNYLKKITTTEFIVKIGFDLNTRTLISNIKSAVKGISVPIKAELDSADFEKKLAKLTRDRDMKVTINFALSKTQLVKDAKEALKGLTAKIKLESNADELEKEITTLSRDRIVKVDFDVNSQRLDNYLKKLTTTEFIIKIGFDLNTRSLISEIKAATKGIAFKIKAELESTEFEKKLAKLTRDRDMKVTINFALSKTQLVKEAKETLKGLTAKIKLESNADELETKIEKLSRDRTVKVDFDVNSQRLDSYLKKLTSTTFTVKIDFKLNTRALISEIKAAVKGINVPVKVHLDSAAFEAKLAKLTKAREMKVTINFALSKTQLVKDAKAALKGITVKIKVELDSADFEKKLDKLTKDRVMKVTLQLDEDKAKKGIQKASEGVGVDVKTNVNTEVLSPKANATANFNTDVKPEFKIDNLDLGLGAGNKFNSDAIVKQIMECCDHIRGAISDASTSEIKAMFDSQTRAGLQNASVDALKSAVGAIGQSVIFPLKGVLTGSFEGIGRTLTDKLGVAMSQALGGSLNLDGNKVGAEIGQAVGSSIRAQLESLFPNFVSKFNKPFVGQPGKEKPVEQKTDKANTSNVIKSSEQLFAGVKLELEGFKGALIASQKQSAALGTSTIALTEEFNKLKAITATLAEKIRSLANSSNPSTSKNSTFNPFSTNTNQSGKSGFLKTDPKTATKGTVQTQVNHFLKEAKALDKEISQTVDVRERSQQLTQLLQVVRKKREQIKADSKNKSFSAEVRKSLAAYNKTNGNLDRLEKLLIARVKKVQLELGQLNRETGQGQNRKKGGKIPPVVNNNKPPNPFGRRSNGTDGGDRLFRSQGGNPPQQNAVTSAVNAIARSVGAEVSTSLRKTLGNILATPKGREVAKDGLVNGVGLAVGTTARIASGGIPGVGMATELGASLATRKIATDVEATIDAYQKVIREGSRETDTAIETFAKTLIEARRKVRRRSRTTNQELDGDATGFGIGNISAEVAGSLVGSKIPLIGAATAMATKKVAIAARNKALGKDADAPLISGRDDPDRLFRRGKTLSRPAAPPNPFRSDLPPAPPNPFAGKPPAPPNPFRSDLPPAPPNPFAGNPFLLDDLPSAQIFSAKKPVAQNGNLPPAPPNPFPSGLPPAPPNPFAGKSSATPNPFANSGDTKAGISGETKKEKDVTKEEVEQFKDLMKGLINVKDIKRAKQNLAALVEGRKRTIERQLQALQNQISDRDKAGVKPSSPISPFAGKPPVSSSNATGRVLVTPPPSSKGTGRVLVTPPPKTFADKPLLPPPPPSPSSFKSKPSLPPAPPNPFAGRPPAPPNPFRKDLPPAPPNPFAGRPPAPPNPFRKDLPPAPPNPFAEKEDKLFRSRNPFQAITDKARQKVGEVREQGSEAIAKKIGTEVGTLIARQILKLLSGKGKEAIGKIKPKENFKQFTRGVKGHEGLNAAMLELEKVFRTNTNRISQVLQNFVATIGNRGKQPKLARKLGSTEVVGQQAQAVVKSVKDAQSQALENYKKVFNEVVKRSGLDPRQVKSFLPKLKTDKNLRPGEGAFSGATNSIELSRQAVQGLATGGISKEDLTALIHEMRHSLQLAFGRLGIKDVANSGKAAIPLIAGKTKQAEESTQAFIENRRALGRSATGKEVKAVRALENDAEIFAQKTSRAIARSLKPQTSKVTAKARNQLKMTQKSLMISAQQVILKAKTSQNAREGDVLNRRVGANRLEAAFRLIGRGFNRAMSRSYPDPADRRQIVSETSGFAASAAMLQFPQASFTAITAPLQVAFAPFVATIGLATKTLTPFVNALAQTLKIIVPIQSRFESIAGNKAGGQRLQGFVQGLSKELNLPLLTAQQNFSKIVAAAKGTKLEGEGVEELFTGISLAIKALGLNSQDAFLVYQGFLQILSKNRLSFEELRLQIAERFPPAIGVFSRALGVSTQELNKLVRKGISGERALSKVSKQLKLEFGKAGREAANNFVSGLTRIENVIFEFQSRIATALEPAFTKVVSTIASLLESFSHNVEKVFAGVATVMIGLFAQVLVGSAFAAATAQFTLFGKSATLVGHAFRAIIPVFSRLYAALTPFAAGLLADLIDDFASLITGIEVKSSVVSIKDGIVQIIEVISQAREIGEGSLDAITGKVKALWKSISNFDLLSIPKDLISFGVNLPGISDIGNSIKSGIADITNSVKSLISDSLGSALSDFFKIDELKEVFSNVSRLSLTLQDTLGGLGKTIEAVFKIARVAIALVGQNLALFFAVLQSIAIVKFLVHPIMLGVSSLHELWLGFKVTAARMKTWNSVLTTLKAGLNNFQVQLSLAVTGLLIFFSTANFTKEFAKDLKKIQQETSSFVDVINSIPSKKTIEINLSIGGSGGNSELEKIIKQQSQFESKGFDLTFGIGKLAGFDAFRTDDYIKALNSAMAEAESATADLGDWIRLLFLGALPTSWGTFITGLFHGEEGFITIAEQQANDLIVETSEIVAALNQSVMDSGLFNIDPSTGDLEIFSSKVGESIASVRDLDMRITELSKQRGKILIDDPAADVTALDAELKQLFDDRKAKIKPAIEFQDSFLREKAFLEEFIENIRNSEQPEFIKKRIIRDAQLGLDGINTALDQIKEIGLSGDINPIAEQFSNIQKEIDKAKEALERFNQANEISTLNAKANITKEFAESGTDEDQLKKDLTEVDFASVTVNVGSLENALAERRSALQGLLEIPKSEHEGDKTAELIKQTTKEVHDLEKNLANERIKLGNMVVSERKEQEKEILDAFKKGLEKQQAELAKTLADAQEETLELQLAGEIDEEIASQRNLDDAIANTVDQLEAKRNELKEINRLRETEIDLLEDSLQKESVVVAEIDRLENELLSKRIEKVNQERDLRLQAIEDEAEARAKAADGITQAFERNKALINQYVSFIESRVKLLESGLNLDKSRGSVVEAESQAESTRIDRALELRNKADNRELGFKERREARQDLSSLGFTGASETELLEEKARLEEQIAKDKAAALMDEQRQNQKLLELENKRKEAAAQTAIIEANIAKLKARQGLLQAIDDRRKAQISGDEKELEFADLGIAIALQQSQLADLSFSKAESDLKDVQDLIQDDTEIKLNEQLAERIRFNSENNLKGSDRLPTEGLERQIKRTRGIEPLSINGRGTNREIPFNLNDYSRFLQTVRIPKTNEMPTVEVQVDQATSESNLLGKTDKIVDLVQKLLDNQNDDGLSGLTIENINITITGDRANNTRNPRDVAEQAEIGALQGVLNALEEKRKK